MSVRRLSGALVLALAAGCGGGGAPSGPTVDAEGFAGCMIKLTASVLGDPLELHLSPALRDAAARGARRVGSVMPRPHGFAAFSRGGTFAPAGFGASQFVPAAFVFFADPGAAAGHEGDADERHGNLLIVYDGKPPRGETGLVAQCLRKVGD